MCHYWSDHSPKTTGMDDKSVPGALMFRDNDICRGPLSSCAKERPCASNISMEMDLSQRVCIYIYIQKAEIHVCNVYNMEYTVCLYNMGYTVCLYMYEYVCIYIYA